MHDEAEAIREIKEKLSRNAKDHLSHVLRNGLCNLRSAYVRLDDVEKRFFELEDKLKEMGL